MNATVQAIVVFVIVAAAMTYSALKFMPAAWRKRVAAAAAALATRAGLSADHARRVEAKVASGGACGSCDSCNACATPAEVATDPSMRIIPIRPLR